MFNDEVMAAIEVMLNEVMAAIETRLAESTKETNH